MAPPATAIAALQQLDEASVWRLLLQARAGRSPVRHRTNPIEFIQFRSYVFGEVAKLYLS